MIKIALFDIDGVVVNPKMMFSKKYCEEFCIKEEIMDKFWNDIFPPCIVGKKDLKEVLIDYLEKLKWKDSVEELLGYWFKAEHLIDDEVVQIIEKLKSKGVICCLASNQEKYRKEYMLKEMGFEDLFDKTYFSSDLGINKPDLKFYELIFDNLNSESNIKNEEIIYFDDGRKEVEAGNRFGFRSYLYSNIEDAKKALVENRLI